MSGNVNAVILILVFFFYCLQDIKNLAAGNSGFKIFLDSGGFKIFGNYRAVDHWASKDSLF